MRIHRGGPGDAAAVAGALALVELVGYYERQGFSRAGTYTVNGQAGQTFERRLGHQPGTAAQ